MRDCVKCGAGFEQAKVGPVEVDFCPSCGGLWLDHQELQQLAGMPDEALAGLREVLRRAVESSGASGRPAAAERTDEQRLDVSCPACRQGKLTHAEVGDVGLEICSGCAGVFIDAGELDRATAEVRERGKTLATIASMARSVTTRGSIGE